MTSVYNPPVYDPPRTAFCRLKTLLKKSPLKFGELRIIRPSLHRLAMSGSLSDKSFVPAPEFCSDVLIRSEVNSCPGRVAVSSAQLGGQGLFSYRVQDLVGDQAVVTGDIRGQVHIDDIIVLRFVITAFKISGIRKP